MNKKAAVKEVNEAIKLFNDKMEQAWHDTVGSLADEITEALEKAELEVPDQPDPVDELDH